MSIAAAESSLDFDDGSTDRVDHGSAASLDNIDPGTAMMWVKFDTYSGFKGLLSKQNSSEEGWSIFHVGTGPALHHRISRATGVLRESTTASMTPDWRFIACVWDSSASTSTVYIGTRTNYATTISSQVGAGSGIVDDDSAGNLYAGNYYSGIFEGAMDGSIGWIGIYDGKMSIEEIHLAQYAPKPYSTNWVLSVFYGFDPTGVQRDFSGMKNDGTISGASATYDGPPISMD